MKLRQCIALTLVAASVSPIAQATVVSGDWQVSTYSLSSTGVPNFLSLYIYQTPRGLGGDGGTGVIWTFDYKAGTLSQPQGLLDEGATFFAVRPGDVASQAQVDAYTATVSLNPILVKDESAIARGDFAHAWGQEFWVGVGTTHSSDPSYDPFNVNHRTSFGWAHIRAFEDGTVSLLDSAMAYREGGIKVGTLQAIPEPGTWALMGLGLVGLVAVRRGKAS